MTAINFFLHLAHSTIEQQMQTKNDMLKRHYCSEKVRHRLQKLIYHSIW